MLNMHQAFLAPEQAKESFKLDVFMCNVMHTESCNYMVKSETRHRPTYTYLSRWWWWCAVLSCVRAAELSLPEPSLPLRPPHPHHLLGSWACLAPHH